MKKGKGVVSAGHKETALAGREILEAGGNAYDATLAAFFASCVAEPVLSSLGGGGAMIAYSPNGVPRAYDFFVQTPKKKTESRLDFYPIEADFGGGVTQTFHIGMGSVATPGCPLGVATIHKELCKLPLKKIIEPAVRLARSGIRVNTYQAGIFDIVEAIYLSNDATRKIFESKLEKGKLLRDGEILTMPHFADTLEDLAERGMETFYTGKIAERIAVEMQEMNGHLSKDDFRSYRVLSRNPLEISYRGSTLLTNPPPSSGGILIAFSLKLLEMLDVSKHTPMSAEYMALLGEVMNYTNVARKEESLSSRLFDINSKEKFLDPDLLLLYEKKVRGRFNRLGGTTHISVIDGEENIASMTVTNGEGAAYIVPGTDIMLNNMLGEEDVNPEGFHAWREDARISSMISPSVFLQEGGVNWALGSGGSNRIRTAILQVLLNITDHKMSVYDAVSHPRVHFEKGVLSIEGGNEKEEADRLRHFFPEVKIWDKKSLFFGGVHVACSDKTSGQFSGAGDPRRDGVSLA